MSTSATGGFLTVPVATDGTDSIFQALLQGITGLDGSKVMPAFQNPKPVYPPSDVNWVAFWFDSSTPDDSPVIEVGFFSRNILYALNIYTYGELSREYMESIINGVTVKQNLEQVMAGGYTYQGIDTRPMQINELFNNQWYKRYNAVLLFGKHI